MIQNLSRRDLCIALSALSLAGGKLVTAEQTTEAPVPTPTGPPLPQHAKAFTFADLPSSTNASSGSVGHAVCAGFLPTGEHVEIHETTLPPGAMPHPAHRHTHTEFIMVREGTLELITEGGRTERTGPGGVVYMASTELHGIRNVGSTPAQYFVIAIGVNPPAKTA